MKITDLKKLKRGDKIMVDGKQACVILDNDGKHLSFSEVVNETDKYTGITGVVKL